MSTPSNAISGLPLESPAVAPAAIPESRRFYWSLRRELWENRSIYIAPLAAAVLILIGFVISMVHLAVKMRAGFVLTPMLRRVLIEQPYSFSAGLIMAVTLIVAFFYCLDALYGERRDRSILFWKSLPVSDLTAVLAKASVPLVVLPLLTFAIIIATQWIMLLLGSAILLASGLSVATLWTHLALGQMWLMLLYHLGAIHALWYAPFYGWLLLVSAWARRSPFLWAVVPPLAIAVVEKIAFNTSYFAQMIEHRFGGGRESHAFMAATMSTHPLAFIHPGQFFISPGLWIGLAIAAAFIAAAVQLRHHRGPM